MKTKNTESKKSFKKVPPPTNSYENYDSQLNEWSQKLEEFKSKLTKLSAELQLEASQKIERLEKKYEDASEKMNDLKSKGLSAKDEVKTGFEKAWKELLQAFDAARKTFH
jgi:chromosome segregation ATPase